MNRSWFGLREPAVAEGWRARPDGQVPMSANVAPSRVARQVAAQRWWWAPILRILGNAVIAAVAMAVIPLATVGVRGNHVATTLYSWDAGVGERMRVIAQPARGFGMTPHPSITPMDAGLALMFLQYSHSENSEFVSIEPANLPARPWGMKALTPDMFVTARPDLYEGPSSRTILEAVAKGFSPREHAYLKALAEAPVWEKFDLVARAPAVDMVGGQLQLPFGPNALPEQRPLPSYRGSRDLAYAAVSRAAYYMSIGEPGKAEEVLRSTISFGLAFIDNGTTTMDEIIGTVIVGVGRDALRRFYLIEHDPQDRWKYLAPPPKGTFHSSRASLVDRMTPDEVRRQLVAMLTDRAMTRPERFEAVRELTRLQCTNTRGMLFGQRDDVREAIERASGSFARYPSEKALVELETRLPSAAQVSTKMGPVQSLLVSPAMVAGAVLHNPRMGACTLLLTAGR